MLATAATPPRRSLLRFGFLAFLGYVTAMFVFAAVFTATGMSWRSVLVLSGVMAVGGTVQDGIREVLRRREWGPTAAWWGSFVVLVLVAVGLVFAIRLGWPLMPLIHE